jgi:hypothetical protein
VNESLKIAEETSKKIESASLQYRPCSVRAAVLYFVLNDLAGIDPMYQFSLDAYNDLFLQSINKSARSEDLQVCAAAIQRLPQVVAREFKLFSALSTFCVLEEIQILRLVIQRCLYLCLKLIASASLLIYFIQKGSCSLNYFKRFSSHSAPAKKCILP